MNGSWFFDENFNGVSDDFFDDAIKFLDFPMEGVEPSDGEDLPAKFQHLDPPPPIVLAGLSSALSGGINNVALEVKKSSTASFGKLLDNCLHIVELWQSSAEASSSRSTSFHHESLESKHSQLFRTSSPVSVLDNGSSSSSSSCSAAKMTSNSVKYFVPVKRPRSKRPRGRRHAVPFISACYNRKGVYPLVNSDLDSESESFQGETVVNSANKRQKKKKNLILLSSTLEIKKPSPQQAVETRKCTHCEVTKTPQWREGPMGPKTLCNACGVRYRSGRLLPEYRPAASPTFIPSLHSNSHRKVLEMRKKAMPVTATGTMDTSLPSAGGS